MDKMLLCIGASVTGVFLCQRSRLSCGVVVRLTLARAPVQIEVKAVFAVKWSVVSWEQDSQLLS